MSLGSILRASARATRTVSSLCCRRFMCSTKLRSDRFYTKKHEWISVSANVGTIGVSSFAQDALGEVVFAQLPEVGKTLAVGDECGALESVKAAGEVYSPVSGTVVEKNEAVESTPSLINESCYELGWLIRVKLANPEELQLLMNQAAYDKYLAESQ